MKVIDSKKTQTFTMADRKLRNLLEESGLSQVISVFEGISNTRGGSFVFCMWGCHMYFQSVGGAGVKSFKCDGPGVCKNFKCVGGVV